MNAVDLFSGCGGMSLGFKEAGFNVVAAFDNWKPAVEIYEANFDQPIFLKDLSDSDASDLVASFHPDIIIGGPPCQDYSIAGKRQLGKRANLTVRFAQIVAEVQPSWAVFENVYNIERFGTLPELESILSGSGYGLTEKILDASLCGVPQTRKRFFLIAHKDDQDGFLEETLVSGLSDTPMTVRDYLGDKLQTQYYYMHPRSYARRAVFSVDEPSATIRGINRPIPPNYKHHPADAAKIEDGVRSLTTKERSYIQTFPEEFNLPGTKTNVELAIGNAVPPLLARYVANSITSYVKVDERKHDPT